MTSPAQTTRVVNSAAVTIDPPAAALVGLRWEPLPGATLPGSIGGVVQVKLQAGPVPSLLNLAVLGPFGIIDPVRGPGATIWTHPPQGSATRLVPKSLRRNNSPARPSITKC